MSTVALRGTLSYDEKTTEWSWTGRWVFGDCVPADTAGAEGTSTTGTIENVVDLTTPSSKSKSNSNKKPKEASQPFLYKWQEASKPSTIPVPSLNVKVIGAAEEEEQETTLSTPTASGQNAPIRNDDTSTPLPDETVSGDDSKSNTKDQPPLLDSEAVEKSTSLPDNVAEQKDKPDPATGTPKPTDATEAILATPTSAASMAQKDSSNSNVTNDAKNENGKEGNGKIEDTKTSTDCSAEITTSNTVTTGPENPPASATTNDEKVNGEKVEKKDSNSDVQQSNDGIDTAISGSEIDGAMKGEEKSTEIKTTVSTPTAIPTTETTLSSDIKSPKTKAEVPPKVTFASVMPEFLDASDKYNSGKEKSIRCPSSGKWKGYFENVIPGKKAGRGRTQQPPQIQKVDETFYLFLNATPSSSGEENVTSETSPDNNSSIGSKEGGKDDPKLKNHPSLDLFAFETATKGHIPKIANSKVESTDANSGASVPPENDSAETKSMISLIQVRGCGENEFGTFEIMGYLDLNTMVMEIQRQYVVTEVPAASPPAPSRRRRSSSNAVGTYEGPRPHSTRKRNPTWKRASYDPEEDRRRKRARPLSGQKQGSPMSIDLTGGNATAAADSNGATFTNSSSIPFTVTSDQSQPSSTGILPNPLSSSMPMSESMVSPVNIGATGRGSKSRLSLPTQSKAMAGSVIDSGGRRRSSTGGSGGGLRSKRRSSSMGKSTTNSASTKSGSTYIRLPAVGDPKKARWRAAHFLYYQRDDPEQRAQQQQQLQSGNNPNSSGSNGTTTNANKVATPKPKYVIYEGEMVDSKREGRGICLFTDGTLYEGEWKRNKEHGYGKLMSSDRKKIIYEGEWERGRMQGTGTYYYGSSDPLQPGPRYIGEFRENLRNGIGRYFLPDGSVYDGQWRDGVMNGLGVFTWPDKSMYDGVWKDGKRNGQGLLKKADGFVYDGQWVNNTMEGRGSAIYPNGQRYEGSFSNGRREGRGTIVFTNGAVYEGRFRDDAVDGQGTMKMSRTMIVPREDKPQSDDIIKKETKTDGAGETQEENRKEDFMIPISFQSDMTRILTKTGFM